MTLLDLLESSQLTGNQLSIIRNECSQFIRESDGLPLYGLLPNHYSTFHKVKVRHRNKPDEVHHLFDHAFGNTISNIRKKAVFTSPIITESQDNKLPYYVFPVNGYQYLYSKQVKNSSEQYKSLFSTLLDQVESATDVLDIMTEVLKNSYNTCNLKEGLVCGSEVIVYHLPHYYAVSSQSCEYDMLINQLK